MRMSEKKTEISSTTIVQNYLRREELSSTERRIATTTYDAFCLSFKKVSAWGKDGAMGKILSQFLQDAVPLFDERCESLVDAMISVDLCALEAQCQKLWCELMVEIAKEHICWTEKIVNKFCKCFIPPAQGGSDCYDRNEVVEPLWSAEKMRPVYTAVQESLWRLCAEFPSTVFVLRDGVERNFPFLLKPAFQIRDYCVNLMHITTWQPPEQLNSKIWSVLIDRLVELDVQKSVGSKKSGAVSEGFFEMDEDLRKQECGEVESGSISEKLDLCLSSLLQFISFWCHSSDASEESDAVNREAVCRLYQSLLAPFRKYVLSAHDLSYTPYIWFYLCSYDSELLEEFLELLWKEVETPEKMSLEFKQHERKAHAAACYMSGLLARAKYINVGIARKWLRTWAEWAGQYLKSRESPGRGSCREGMLADGTFYAICQAIFFVVGFRYKELLGSRSQGLEEMRSWGLDRLANCSLNPFRYCAPQVVMNFANVSRAMQLVYCHHIIEKNRKDLHERNVLLVQTPFEGFFPFDPCDLQECAKYIKPMYRNYQGLSEDNAGTAKSEDAWNQRRLRTTSLSRSANSDQYDFIEEQDEMLISYGASPGFKHNAFLEVMEMMQS